MLLPYKLESYLFKESLIDNILGLWQAIAKKEVIKMMSYFLVAEVLTSEKHLYTFINSS